MSRELVNISRYGFSTIQIETMSICNMNCTFCPYPLRHDKGKILPEETILSIIDSLSIDNDFEYISFQHINEPLLDKRIYKFIKYAKNKKLPVRVITNGLLFNSKEVIYKLIESGADCIKVSLHILNSELFRKARGINYSFQQYKKGIFEFLKAAQDSSAKIIVDFGYNFLSMARKAKMILFGTKCSGAFVYDRMGDLRNDLKQFLHELQSYDEHFISDDKMVDIYLDQLKLHYKKQEGINITRNISVKIKPFIYWNGLLDFYPVKKTDGCPNDILGILASGYVVPCCLAYDNILCLGDIKKDTLYTILERNAGLISCIQKGIGAPLACRKCRGAPTKRGVILRQIKNEILDKFYKIS